MTATTDETVADRLEAEARKLMSRLTEARGWDSRARREDELAHLDVLLDQWNEQGHADHH